MRLSATCLSRAEVEKTLLGIPVTSIAPTVRRIREGTGTSTRVLRRASRPAPKPSGLDNPHGRLARLWISNREHRDWGAFRPIDFEKASWIKHETQWMRVALVLAGLGREGFPAILRTLDWMDTGQPFLAGRSPFAALQNDEQFGELVAWVSLTGGTSILPGSVQEKRFQDFRESADILKDALDGVPAAKRLYDAVSVFEPRWIGFREIISCRSVDENSLDTLIDWYRIGRLDDIERQVPKMLLRTSAQAPW